MSKSSHSGDGFCFLVVNSQSSADADLRFCPGRDGTKFPVFRDFWAFAAAAGFTFSLPRIQSDFLPALKNRPLWSGHSIGVEIWESKF